MINLRRKFLNSLLLLSGTLGVFKSIPNAHACGLTYDGEIYRSINSQLDLSPVPLAKYLIKFYGTELPIQKKISLNILSKEYVQNSNVVPVQVKIPTENFEKNFKNLECSHFDIFSQIMNGIIEGPIYRIASFSFAKNTFPNIKFRYRRDFTYSRLITVAILIDKVSKKRTKIIYNYTNIVRGAGPCNLTLPSY